jgi:hypothetical protein
MFFESDFGTESLEFQYATPSNVESWPSGEMWITMYKRGIFGKKIICGKPVVISKDKATTLKEWINSLEL